MGFSFYNELVSKICINDVIYDNPCMCNIVETYLNHLLIACHRSFYKQLYVNATKQAAEF